MKKLFAASVIFSLLLSCGPPGPSGEGEMGCVPADVNADVNREKMTVSWIPNCDRVSSGYNIYISQEPLAAAYPGTQLSEEIIPHNHMPFLGDTDPSDGRENYEAEGLTDGLPYYVSVRIVFPDGSLSKPSEEIIVVCGARGEIELSMRFKSDRDGFSFRGNEYVRADGVDNDLYFFSKDGVDYIGPPRRLGGFLRSTRLAVLPIGGEFEDIIPALKFSSPLSERVVVRIGDWLHIITVDGGQAVLRVKNFAGHGGLRRVVLQYAFTPGPGPLVF